MTITNKERLSSAAVKQHMPGLHEAGYALSRAVHDSSLGPELAELIFLRASQINGCAHCVHMHAGKLDQLGTSKAKQMLVSTWEEAGIFSEREEAAFRWTEALTLLAVDHVPDSAWDAVSAVFSEQEIVELTAAVNAINFWNRLAVPFRFPPDL